VLAVERADTLLLLLQDRPQLNQALDAAGLPPGGRTLQFSLVDAGVGAPSSPGSGPGETGFGAGSGTGAGPGNGPGTGSGTGSGSGGGGAFSGQGSPGGGHRPPATTAWQRAGVDITA
jgi:hypothetical protein